jgi:hypothetical protein
MKTLIALCALVASLVTVTAADPPRGGRVDNRVIAGVKNNVQDELYRLNLPVFVTTAYPDPFFITNTWEGQYFVNTNNTIGLPNPTNNYPRKFTFMALGTNQFYVSNGLGGQLRIASSNLVAPLCLIASNRMAMAWSTGTNWIVLP